MNIAIISGGTVINTAVFEDLKTAEEFLTMRVWPGAEAVVELPDGYGIGDSYDGSAWTKAPAPEPEPEPEPEPTATLEERVTAIEDAIEKGLSI